MSRKYVPSFLRDQASNTSGSTSNNTSNSTNNSFWPGQGADTNKFAALSDDYPTSKPIINTSRPAMEAPKLAPATLASITSNGSSPVGAYPTTCGYTTVTGGSKKSFASKFAENVKIANDPNYKPPVKPISITSEDDFPALGGPKRVANAIIAPPKPKKTGITVSIVEETAPPKPTGSFADMAKSWAKQKEDEAENTRKRLAEEERLRRENTIMSRIPNMCKIRRRADEDENDNEFDDYNNDNYDESSLGDDDDSYEVPEGEVEPSDEDEENQGEFNSDVGWDGRKRGDLY